MKKILLKDLLNFSSEQIEKVKVKFNQHNGDTNPMEEYIKNPEAINTGWLFWRREKRYFNEGEIAICFFKLGKDTWVLSTIKLVTKELNKKNGINYEGEELEKYSAYYGRVIVKHHKKYQNQVRKFKMIIEDLEVSQILPTIYDGEEFPGYDNVSLSYNQLKIIITKHKRDWINALKNQKAVYLITDKESGKHYIGSATESEGMLLTRWTTYIKNGHGGNELLKDIINEKGFNYIKENFQYSILENYNARIDDKIIITREGWWKRVLNSRTHGLNLN